MPGGTRSTDRGEETGNRLLPDPGKMCCVTVRVFLLDDHELVREGIRTLLESDADIEVVGEAATADQALTRIPLAKPDVAILDVRLEEGNGIEVCRDLRSEMPGMACLMLTSFADDEALYSSVMAGAAGFVLKQIRARDLIDDVKKVAIPVLRHRVSTNFQAQAEGKTSEDVIAKLLDTVQPPEIGKYDKKRK